MNLLSIVCVLLIALGPARAKNRKVYWAPDRAGATGESRVEFQTTTERTLQLKDETSPDGSHGRGVVHAAWTPDSQFFVAGTEVSGGHQPWARPIWVYSRPKNQILDLGKMGAIAVADFTLKFPDVIQTKVLDCERGKRDLASRPFIISLHQVANGRLPKPPCPAR